jgi:hypothetical protein
MPIQDTGVNAKQYMRIKDGCKVSIKAATEVSYTSFGALKGNTDLKINWTEVQAQTANAGKTGNYAKQATVEGQITLYNLDMANIMRTTSGLFAATSTAASENSSIPDQTIAAGWEDHVVYELVAETSGTDATRLKLPTKPVFTSVKIATDTTPETLAEIGSGAAGDYMVVEMPGSISGWGIIFNSDGMTVSNPTTRVITIDWGANTPTARITYKMGSSFVELASFAMLFEYVDSAGKESGREIYKCYSKPGAITLGYGGADEDGFEEMQIQFNGVLDTTRADGDQLMSAYVDQ